MAARAIPDITVAGAPEPARAFRVDGAAAGQRLDVFLAQAAGITRSQARRLVAGGHVEVLGRPAKPGSVLRGGEQITLSPPPPRPSASLPQPLPLDIVYEDDDILVVNKPPGLVVHPAAGHQDGTLVNALLHHRPHLRSVGGEERPGIVHRLDKDTSGLVLVAKTPAAHAALSAQFADRSIAKTYLALVHGAPAQESGEVRAPIGRHAGDRKRMGVRARKGREAVTLYRVLERLGDVALLELAPKTGRTHQLRVHLAHLGHPILGDAVYGGRRERARRGAAVRPQHASPQTARRQMLHAWKLSFRHPRTGEPLAIEAPVPADLAAALGTLRGAPPALPARSPSAQARRHA